MSLPQVEKFLFQVANDSLRRQNYDQDKASLLDSYDLTNEERKAIESVDITTLFGMQIEPLLIQPFAAMHNINGPELFAACRKASNWDNRAELNIKHKDPE
jgi:hypothetical protein